MAEPVLSAVVTVLTQRYRFHTEGGAAACDAVKLKADNDIRCQAMTFHSTWPAQFQATR
jgi:hypothetical protein